MKPVINILLISLALTIGVGSFSCISQHNKESISQSIRNNLLVLENNPNFRIAGEPLLASEDLLMFYQLNAYQPVWSDEYGLTGGTYELIESVSSSTEEGLNPEDYHYQKLWALVKEATKHTSHLKMAHMDLLLTDAYLLYARHLFVGKVCPDEVSQEWFVPCREMEMDYWVYFDNALKGDSITNSLDYLKPRLTGYQKLKSVLSKYRKLAIAEDSEITIFTDVERIKQKLIILGDLTGEPQDELVFEQAIGNFQRRHGLKSSKMLDSLTLKLLQVSIDDRIAIIEANLERWRWLPEDLGTIRIEVNMADYSLEILDRSKTVFRSDVIIGKPYHATPAFSAMLTQIILNPYWNIPVSIAINEILKLPEPGKYLEQNNIRVLNQYMEKLDLDSIPWEVIDFKNSVYRMRQEPGPNNALGVVKFLFPNPYSVYIHDTPQKQLFDADTRTFSHGCIRLQNPLGLATYLLSSNTDWDKQSLIDTIKTHPMPTEVDLPKPLPVHILYWTAWLDKEGNIQFREDVYNRDQSLIEALKVKLNAN